MNMPELPPAPPALHRGGGRPVADGRYAGAIADLDTRAWDGRGPLSRRRWQRKGWLYVGTVSARQHCGFAIVDGGWFASAFVYLHDRASGQYVEEKITLPWGFAAGFAPDWRRDWQLKQGTRVWSVRRQADAWSLAVQGRRISLSLQVDDHGRGLSAVSALPGRPFHHTYKLAGLRCTGSARVAGRTLAIEGRSNLDFSLGYPPRETRWHWASLDGVTEAGRPVALNLVAHFMNGLENALWSEDQLIALPQAVFELPAERRSPWRIATVDGALDLRFFPEGQRAESLRLGLFSSVFQQPFGRFEGHWQQQERRERLSGYGVVEQHYARW